MWLAERVDGSIQRKVALKLPHLGLVDRGIAERIARERDILASLEHPEHRAAVRRGRRRTRPAVPGAGIRAGRAARRVLPRRSASSLRQKLQLFLNILRAVAFAHARLIVHRDLKPNNILVARGRRRAACSISASRGCCSRIQRARVGAHTVMGAAALTPAYAAPEQFTGQPVTVATDVYSLGVILLRVADRRESVFARRVARSALTRHEVLHVEPPLVEPRRATGGGGRTARAISMPSSPRRSRRSPPIATRRWKPSPTTSSGISRPNPSRRGAARSATWRANSCARNALPVSLRCCRGRGARCVALGVAAWQWRDAERQRAMAVERLANAEAAATVHVDGAHRRHAARRVADASSSSSRAASRSRAIPAPTTCARAYSPRISSPTGTAPTAVYRNAEALLTRTIESLPARVQPARRRAALHARATCGASWAARKKALAALHARTRAPTGRRRDRLAVPAGALLLRRAMRAMRNGSLEYRAAGAGALRSSRAWRIGLRPHGHPAGRSAARHGLRGEFAAAHAHYREALRTARPPPAAARSRAAANLHDDWSSLWMNAGNPRRALEELDLGWEILRELAAERADLSDDRRDLPPGAHSRAARASRRSTGGFREVRARSALARGNLVTLRGHRHRRGGHRNLARRVRRRHAAAGFRASPSAPRQSLARSTSLATRDVHDAREHCWPRSAASAEAAPLYAQRASPATSRRTAATAHIALRAGSARRARALATETSTAAAADARSCARAGARRSKPSPSRASPARPGT